jgi:UDP-N-acetylmuramate--alanine ligase
MTTKVPGLPLRYTQRLIATNGAIPELFLHIDTSKQNISIVNKGTVQVSYPVSTALQGIGSKRDSMQTPLGIHRIIDKIGAAAPSGSIFRDRINTGNIWFPAMKDPGNLILSRILRLEGLEHGINRGGDVDSFERYIYIHGTNREDCIGTPFSHGCICMKNQDIIELFERIPEKTIVIIT